MAVLDFIVGFIVDIIGYSTARFLLPVLTFGSIRVEKVKSPDSGFNWLGFKRSADGALLCASDLAGWIGVVFWALVLIAILVTVRIS